MTVVRMTVVRLVIIFRVVVELVVVGLLVVAVVAVVVMTEVMEVIVPGETEGCGNKRGLDYLMGLQGEKRQSQGFGLGNSLE